MTELVEAARVSPLLSSRLLHLILMPTEQCNFRCVYCYEDFSRGAMGRRVVDAVRALIERRVPRLDQLAVEWFGGEPMLAWPVVEEIQAFAHAITRGGSAPALTGSMTTNGSLLDELRFRRLLKIGVDRFQISIDGEREAHDRLRRRRGGGGSFERIRHNLDAMRGVQEDFRVLLRLHATRQNLDSLGRLLEDLAESFAGDGRFRVMPKAIRRLGGPADAELPVLDRRDEGAILGRLADRAETLGLAVQRSPFEAGGVQACYASAVGSYVVRSNGELGKCTVALGHPGNRVGTLRPDGTVELDAPRMTGWIRGALSGDSETQRCPLKGWLPRPAAAEPRLVQLGRAGA